MIPWLLRRLATSLLLVFLLMSAVFFIVRLAPGDPLDQVVAQDLGRADRELMRRQWGLDGSLAGQYGRWLAATTGGDLGTSLRQQRPVRAIVAEALPPTLLLTGVAYVLHLLLAGCAGLLGAARPDSWADRLVRSLGLVLYSVPAFWLGLMLIMLAGRQLGWFPAGGLASADAVFMSPGARCLDLLRHLALPVWTLALSTFMGTARYLQSSLEEALGQDYILAGRSRGLGPRTVLLRHALRNALLPLITLAGLRLPFLLGGAVVIEVVFGWPGMGRVTVEAIWARDYPVIMATTLIAGVTVTLGSLAADLLYRWADPRVRVDGAAARR